jgi:hypothetical protein
MLAKNRAGKRARAASGGKVPATRLSLIGKGYSGSQAAGRAC